MAPPPPLLGQPPLDSQVSSPREYGEIVLGQVMHDSHPSGTLHPASVSLGSPDLATHSAPPMDPGQPSGQAAAAAEQQPQPPQWPPAPPAQLLPKAIPPAPPAQDNPTAGIRRSPTPRRPRSSSGMMRPDRDHPVFHERSVPPGYKIWVGDLPEASTPEDIRRRVWLTLFQKDEDTAQALYEDILSLVVKSQRSASRSSYAVLTVATLGAAWATQLT